MSKAIPSKLHLAFDLMFISCLGTTHFFSEKQLVKIDLEPEEKSGDFQGANSCSTPACVTLGWSFDFILWGFSTGLSKFELNEFRAPLQPWQPMNRVPFLAPSLIPLAPGLQRQTIAAQMAAAAKRAPDRLWLHAALEHHLNKDSAVLQRIAEPKGQSSKGPDAEW